MTSTSTPMDRYHDLAFTPEAVALQQRNGSRAHYERMADAPAPSGLGPHEIDHITARDSFYLASVGSNGWPYVQHRGGPAGFVSVLGPTTIGWLEQRGNGQFVSTGNLSASGRVSLIFMDYPARTRLKLYGRATLEAEPDDGLLAALGHQGRPISGAITVEVAAFDWNCPKQITPRFTATEVASVIDPLRERIAELEAQLAGRPTGPSSTSTPSAP